MTMEFNGRVDESAVVHLADKLVRGKRRVRLETRFAPAFARFAGDPEALPPPMRRYAGAQAILNAVDRSPDWTAIRLPRRHLLAKPRRPAMTCCDRRLHLGLTESVCPVCLATIPAERCAEGENGLLIKDLPGARRAKDAGLARTQFLSALGASPAQLFPAAGLRHGGEPRLPPRLWPVAGTPPAKLLRAA